MFNLLTDAANTAGPVIDLSTVDFSPVASTVTSVIPQALTFVVTMLAIRKGISMLMSLVRRA